MPPGTLIDVIIPPGIFGDGIGLKVRPVPVLRVAGRDEEVLQPVLALGIIAVIDVEGVEGGFHVRDLSGGRRDLGLFGPIRKPGQNDGGKDAQDDQHQQQLHQGEGVLMIACRAQIFCFHRWIWPEG